MQIVNLGQGSGAPAPLGNRWTAAREEWIDAECLVAANLAGLILLGRPSNILVILREVAAKTPNEKVGVT